MFDPDSMNEAMPGATAADPDQLIDHALTTVLHALPRGVAEQHPNIVSRAAKAVHAVLSDCKAQVAAIVPSVSALS